MTNTNCLADIRCPDCGNEAEFRIEAVIVCRVTDEGSEPTGEHHWDKDSYCHCPGCEKEGKLSEFFTDTATKLTHEELRTRHYERLNNYRNSVEYQASPNCWQEPTGPLKTLIGDRWEIDEQIYDDFLGMLPPMGWRGGSFYMSEFSFDDITAKFTKEGDRFYCEFARFPGRAAA